MGKVLNISQELKEHFDELLYYNKEELEKLDRIDALKEGREQGREEGIEEGISQRNIEIAKSLLEQNVSLDIIIKSTGLSKEEIESIK